MPDMDLNVIFRMSAGLIVPDTMRAFRDADQAQAYHDQLSARLCSELGVTTDELNAMSDECLCVEVVPFTPGPFDTLVD